MMHATIRATLLPEIIKIIQSKYNWSDEEAMDRFYTSAIGELFSDDDLGLYGQSALYIAGLFFEEMENKSKD
ncbi:MAG: hypothetical protein IJ535_09830 [Pseudobutyrivibrio sp.]|nr:hypothetical protein [Pseudobutyrivibrio sp.]